ncbi:hypothetical protein COB11_00950 [Candidatus Aerophobetes bacterium]|uniref:Glycosyl transferase n=1 Tax=Aerophobetes bacterium TaxID=2030807 RepID=A0A2A4YNG7_UNCAE|nr:MAG: hypothetical protein COB11_00950 [Candidatus Aerophobetes bacterium]
MKKFVGLFLFTFALLNNLCSSEKTNDFHTLQGKKTKNWDYVLKSDINFLEKYKDLYLANGASDVKLNKIPKFIHFIWIGPKDFPSNSIKNVISWVEKHPAYEVCFWSDRDRPLPHPEMKFRKVQDFNWGYLEDLYHDSDNYAEKADLLRYEILFQEGGIYVDHDVECYKPFDKFVSGYDLFCGLEPLHAPLGSTAVEACNNLIGACPSHPILKKAIELSQKNWEYYKNAYQGSDVGSVTKRVYFRTFCSFSEAVHQMVFDSNFRNIVLPAGFFNKIEGNFGVYAHHFYDSTWFESETQFEKNVRKRLLKICRKNNQVMLIVSVFFIILTFVIICLFLQIRLLRKHIEKKN